MPADLRGALILAGAFLVLLLVAEGWARLGRPPPEWTRKLVHLASGAVCLLVPFLIQSPWVVLVLALGLSALFGLARRTGTLSSLHGIARRSRGAELYPLAIWLVFLLTLDRSWLYVAAVLVLAVGDALAALVGGRYGVVRYRVEDQDKSLEGSLVFLVVAFLAIHLPTLLLTDLGRTTCVLAALLVALLATGFEAISLGGADNILVPLAVVIVLGKITSKPLPEIVFQNLSLVGMVLVTALMVASVPSFNVGSTIVFILYAYGNWSLGSWQWALPVFIGLACYLTLWARLGSPQDAPRLGVRAVSRALVPPFLLLAVANGTHHHAMLFGPYLAASTAVLCFAVARPLSVQADRRGGRLLLPIAIVGLGSAATGLPVWLLQEDTPLTALLVLPAAVLPALFLLMSLEGRPTAPPTGRWTAGRFLLSLAVAGLVLLLQGLGLAPMWNPP